MTRSLSFFLLFLVFLSDFTSTIASSKEQMWVIWVSQNEGIYEGEKIQITRMVITRTNAMQVGVGELKQEGRSTVD
jgi:hypothetical protein